MINLDTVPQDSIEVLEVFGSLSIENYITDRPFTVDATIPAPEADLASISPQDIPPQPQTEKDVKVMDSAKARGS